MRALSPEKQGKIRSAAAELFAAHPFHKVTLEGIAAAAGVGKGTIYLYCRSKEDLYVSLLDQGFGNLIERLHGQLAEEPSAIKRLTLIVDGLVDYAFAHPAFFELMRTTGVPSGRPCWDLKRRQLAAMILATIRQGVRDGVMKDPDPALSSLIIPGMVRSVMLYGPKSQRRATVKRQILRWVRAGVVQTKEGARP